MPILLGALAVSGGVPDAARLYAIVFVVVTLSVVVQGGSLPWVVASSASTDHLIRHPRESSVLRDTIGSMTQQQVQVPRATRG